MYSDFTSIKIQDIDLFKSKLVTWADRFNNFIFLDSNKYTDIYSNFDFIIAIDILDFNKFDTETSDFLKWMGNDFVFGHFNYEFQHKSLDFIPKIETNFEFEDTFFFKPRYIVFMKEDRIYFNRNYPETYEWLEQINAIEISSYSFKTNFRLTISKEDYIKRIQEIQTKIKKGSFYEINYCVEFLDPKAQINPINYFLKLNQKALAPMSALYKKNGIYALSVSPERFLALRGDELISQPIKGTAKRDLKNKIHDESIKQELESSPKERAENMMIVDLVRNDLTHCAKTGSIEVKELCKPYSFNFVHQLISTIVAKIESKKDSLKSIINCFPAGSMTGAPKREVMKYIEEIENFKRGLYAGNIGYFSPSGDFDFNVVIRTLFYNQKNKIASIKVGGAITLLSNPEKEYEECLLKAQGIIENSTND